MMGVRALMKEDSTGEQLPHAQMDTLTALPCQATALVTGLLAYNPAQNIISEQGLKTVRVGVMETFYLSQHPNHRQQYRPHQEISG